MTVLDHAIAYIDLGWALCSISPGTKGPTTPGWNKTGSVIQSTDAATAEFTAHPANGLGLIHSASGTCAVDIDDVTGWNAILAEYGIDGEALLAGAPRIIGREGRDKAIFLLPDGCGDLRRRALAWPAMPGNDKPVTVFELRAGPVQDVLPPTIHPDTHQPYRWREGTEPWGRAIPVLPAQLLAMWRAWDSFKSQLARICPWASAPTAGPAPPVPRKRPRGPGDSVIGQFNAAHSLEAILEAQGYVRRGKRFLSPTSSSNLAGVVLFEDGTHCYSHHASDPLNDGHAHDAFDLFCLFDHGGDQARAVRAAAELLHLQRLPDLPVVDSKALIANARKRRAAAPAVPDNRATTIPGELTRVPGVLGEMVDFIVDSAIKPQRVLAVAAALAYGGTCMARCYASTTGLRTNPYIIGVAPSTAGKEHARRVIKNALAAAGLKARIGGEDIKSGSAVFGAVHRSPAILFQLDEFGLFLQAVTSPVAGSYQADIMRQLMIMRTSANTIVMGPEYSTATRGERQDIEYPNVVVHGTTTDEAFWPALSSSHVLNGFLNRHLVMHAEGPGVRQQPRLRDADMPSTVIQWAKQVSHPESLPGANLIGVSPGSPRIIGETATASAILEDFACRSDEEVDRLRGTGLDGLWGRAHAQAVEIALIVAGSLNPQDPRIDDIAARWAVNLVGHWTERLVDDCRERIVDTQFAARCEAVMRILRRGTTPDRSYTKRDLRHYWRGWSQLRPFEQDEILKALVERGDAVAGARKGQRGPAVPAWVAREFAPEELVQEDAE